MIQFRQASAVALTRGGQTDLEVYLVERSPELRFFGGYWALPGGVIEAIDRVGGADQERAARRSALRELFEETGVLLPPLRARIDPAARDRLRAELEESGSSELWQREQETVDRTSATLSRIVRFTTPEFAPVRYETLFLHAELPAEESPRIIPGELVQGRFLRPREALDAWRRGDLAIVPPVLLLLELLALDPDLTRFAARALELERAFDRGALHPVRFTPGIVLAALRTPTLPPATTTNCLLVGTDEISLVDPGAPEPAEQARLFEALDALVSEGKTLRSVLLTHHHRDHVGAVAAVSARYRLEVLAHPQTLDRLPAAPYAARALQDGDRLPLGRAPDGSPDWHLRALHTPGHARGHLTFVESRYRAALVGDLMSGVSTILIDPPEGHLATYLRSLERLLAEPIGTVYPAHGPPHRDGHAMIRQLLQHRARREQLLRDALQAGPRTVDELVPVVYADTDPAAYPLAARSLVAGLEKLVEEGVAIADGSGWQLSSRAAR